MPHWFFAPLTRRLPLECNSTIREELSNYSKLALLIAKSGPGSIMFTIFSDSKRKEKHYKCTYKIILRESGQFVN